MTADEAYAAGIDAAAKELDACLDEGTVSLESAARRVRALPKTPTKETDNDQDR